MKDKRIITMYLLGTFLLTYIMWGTILICNRFGFLKVGSIGFWLIYPVGGLASTFFGAYLSKASGKVRSFKALFFEAIKLKSYPKNYFFILVLFVVYFGVPFILGTVKNTAPLYIGLLYIFQMIFFGGLEEIGWRYTFQPALERHIPFWVASVITGSLWALWHLPLFFIDGMNKGMNFGLFAISVFAMSFMLGAIYRITNNLWLCILFHAMINAFSQIWIATVSVLVTVITASIEISCTIVIVSLHNRKSKTVT